MKSIQQFFLIIILIVVFSKNDTLFGQSLVINEVMASNGATIRDEDGDTPDWIELYNRGQQPIDLNGFGLSDDATAPYKWTFPAISLPPNQFLLVFASNKDRRNWLNWETIIDKGDQWRYRLGTSEPPPNWRAREFDDSNWYLGPSGFGYGDNDDATTVPQVMSVYVRKSFFIADKNQIVRALLHVDFDDGFVAYLNDREIARSNIGTYGDHPAYNQTAWTYREAQMYQGGTPEEYELLNPPAVFETGKNVLAIQVHNSGPESSDLSLIPFLTIGSSAPITGNPRGVSRFLNLKPDYLHTNFKINASGEIISLHDAHGHLIDQIELGPLPTDVSFGRQPDAGSNWFYFLQPTPKTSNTTVGYRNLPGEPAFSHASGFYTTSLLISISASDPQNEIYYTLDGSVPSKNSQRYLSPISISKTTVVRAREFSPDGSASATVTRNYLINETIRLPVVCLTTDPYNLWDPDSGIYVLGKNYDPSPPHYGANFWQDWERPVHVDFFEPGGALGFSLNAGMKIFGGWTRDFAQKSLAIFARSRYGTSEIQYQLFPDKPIDHFESFVLRNSGNDWSSTMFRDGMMQNLLNGTDLDLVAYRPAVVFLNGQYWGILNIREKINEHYLAANRHVDPDELDLLENNIQLIHGDATHYQTMLNYMTTHDIRLSTVYDSVKKMMDIANFMDYQIAQIYFDNRDWPGNNVKYWRPRTSEGRWKWIVFDTDFGFGLWNAAAYRDNTLEFATEANGPDWPNPPWSTFLLRRLLENPQFKNDFINRFADHLNATFEPKRVIQKIDSIKTILQLEIPRHQLRWRDSARNWAQNVQNLKQFATYRPNFVRTHLIGKFNLNGIARVSLQVIPPNSGIVRLNSLRLTNFPWQGDYFQKVPIQITAIPNPGFRFVGWSDTSLSNHEQIILNLSQDLSLIAKFEPIDITPVVQSENPRRVCQLKQNYPNPFNAATIIEFELAQGGLVTLEIFNLSGQKVATFVNKELSHGHYQFEWQPQSNTMLSSAIYLAKIKVISHTARYEETKKLIYLK
ncbi:MAG: CotH kinase family protein [candidate division KSB1 bacterium]|nr:CotH kinase family protein [candidate division KSB1 bacterium]MDZ7358571.1 CotH kinase family protein [candidate division KSB1 bacterium]MDZ7401511.1 CotH kinase family protein [candidate division KSB1 bacterium]